MKVLRLNMFLVIAFVLVSMVNIGCGGGGGSAPDVGGGEANPGGGGSSAGNTTEYIVTLSTLSNGKITATPAIPANGKVKEGAKITFTAKPDTNYEVGTWSGATVSTSNPNEATLTVSKDATVGVTFKKKQYTVTLTKPDKGTITASPEIPTNGMVDVGTEITFTVEPATDYVVSKWNGATVSSSNANEATLTVSKNVSVSAKMLPQGMVEVETPQGAFTTDVEFGSSDNPFATPENPQVKFKGVFYKGRKVKLTTYCIGETEVTYDKWREVYNWAIKPENGYTFAHAGKAGASGQTASAGSELPEDTTYGNHPVTNVNWRDCLVWCNAYTDKIMGEEQCVYRVDNSTDAAVLKDATATAQVDVAFVAIDKKGFRLPTEAEWEFAARYEKGETNNDDNTAVAYGDNLWLTKLTYGSGATADYTDKTVTGEVAWFGKSGGNSGNTTHEVGSKTKNKLGLADMGGNVWEWCFDEFSPNNATTSDATYSDADYSQNIAGEDVIVDPQGAKVSNPQNRSARGGSWNYELWRTLVGYRGYWGVSVANSEVGFRLVCRP